MLKIIESFHNLPTSLEFDPDIYFQPGQMASLKIKNGKPVITICDGLHPFGIIDDIKSDVTRRVAYTIEIILPNFPIIFHKNKFPLPKNHVITLNKNIIASSFHSEVSGKLDVIKGIFTIPKGTLCNFKKLNYIDNSHDYCGLHFQCRYAFNEKHDKIEDSTVGSNRITIWSKNMIVETDMYDTSQSYHDGLNLYVEKGLITSKRTDYMCKCIGIVLKAPDADNVNLKYILDLDGKIDVGKELLRNVI